MVIPPICRCQQPRQNWLPGWLHWSHHHCLHLRQPKQPNRRRVFGHRPRHDPGHCERSAGAALRRHLGDSARAKWQHGAYSPPRRARGHRGGERPQPIGSEPGSHEGKEDPPPHRLQPTGCTHACSVCPSKEGFGCFRVEVTVARRYSASFGIVKEAFSPSTVAKTSPIPVFSAVAS